MRLCGYRMQEETEAGKRQTSKKWKVADRMEIGIISFTKAGDLLAEKISSSLTGQEEDSFTIEKICLMGRSRTKRKSESADGKGQEAFPSLSQAARSFWQKDILLFIGACGIAVRAIAPLLNDKYTDPAVLVMDEKARFVIPLLSGHIGGANAFAGRLSMLLGSEPVLTTATDVNDTFAVDVFAKQNHLYIYDREQLKRFSAALLEGAECGILFTNRTSEAEKTRPFENTAVLLSRNLYLGIGCRKGKTVGELSEFVKKTAAEYDLCIQSIAGIASIDLKKEETGLLELAQSLQVPICFYSAEQLRDAEGSFSSSEFVSKITGVENVCERAAFLASGEGRCLVGKRTENGMTLAVYEKQSEVTALPDKIRYETSAELRLQ